MARSTKRQPFIGVCPAHTAKPYKQAANRLFRRRARWAMQAGNEPHWSMKSTVDPRLLAYDNKVYRAGISATALRK